MQGKNTIFETEQDTGLLHVEDLLNEDIKNRSENPAGCKILEHLKKPRMYRFAHDRVKQCAMYILGSKIKILIMNC